MIIAVGYGITNWAMPAHKAILVCAILSALICVALLLLCKYSDVAGALLGKKAKEPHWLTGKVAQIAIALITLPLAFKLIGLI